MLEELSSDGFFCAQVREPGRLRPVCAELRPQAVLLSGPSSDAEAMLVAIRQVEELRGVPVLADHPLAAEVGLDVEDRISSAAERQRRLEHALKAREALEQDRLARRRLEALLEIGRAAGGSLELDEVLRSATETIARVMPADRCALVLVEGETRSTVRVVTRRGVVAPAELELARYPELQKALRTREAVFVDDVEHDPLFDEVRAQVSPAGVTSVLVQPLLAQGELYGALFLRLTQADATFGPQERAFAQGVAQGLASAIRNARQHAELRRRRDELESAYVDRYQELADANRRLREAGRLKDELIAVISHDLRAPLQVLLGHARLLLDARPAPPQKASVEAVERMGKKILELVENLLERGRAGVPFTLDARELDVAELCQEMTSELSMLAGERGIALRAEAPESLVAVADEVKLRQVLQNLVTNALEHAAQAGVVTVRAQRVRGPDGDFARVVVEDDGAGIAPDELRGIFDRYRRGAHAKPGGHGLGLAICRDLVELHGGEIWADSQPSAGTRFTFTLPLARELVAKQPSAPVGEARANVLLIADDQELAKETFEALRPRYRVDWVRDGDEGLAAARRLQPDLIVVDVFVPKRDGIELLTAIRSGGEASQVPVIVMSAHAEVTEKVRRLDLGAVDYLSRPFRTSELVDRIDAALRLRDVGREAQRARAALTGLGADPDTGLLNRSALHARLEQELARSTRYGRPLTLASVRAPDLAPAQVLEVARLLRRMLRAPDVLAHLGQGLMVALLPESDVAQAHVFLARVVAEIGRAFGVLVRVQATRGEGSAGALIDGILAKT